MKISLVTGAPGSGKTHTVRHSVLQHQRSSFGARWGLHRHGVNPQLTFHRSTDGSTVVAGGYVFDDHPRWRTRRNTVPANGGTDTLQPQSTGLLAALLRGDMAKLGGGPAPATVVVECCSIAKMGKLAILDALLDADQLVCIELVRPRSSAVAALTARDRDTDGKGVRGVAAADVHEKYAKQVVAIREGLQARATARGLGNVVWRDDNMWWRTVEWRDADAAVEGALYHAIHPGPVKLGVD